MVSLLPVSHSGGWAVASHCGLKFISLTNNVVEHHFKCRLIIYVRSFVKSVYITCLLLVFLVCFLIIELNLHSLNESPKLDVGIANRFS